MSKNPYAIKPGEKLSPAELLGRHLDWSNHNQASRDWERREGCDPRLHVSYLCCEHHRQVSNDYDAFFDYFINLRMVEHHCHGFSIDSLVALIKKFDIKVDDKLLRKLIVYWGSDSKLGLKKMTEEGVRYPVSPIGGLGCLVE